MKANKSTLSLIPAMLSQRLQLLPSLLLWFLLASIPRPTPKTLQPNYPSRSMEYPSTVKKLLHTLTSSPNVLPTSSVLSTASGSLPQISHSSEGCSLSHLGKLEKVGQDFSKFPSSTKPLLSYACFKSESLL